MKLKILTILSFTIYILNIQSAGIFKLEKINNQTDKTLVVIYFKQQSGFVQYHVEPNTTKKLNKTILDFNKSWTTRRLNFVFMEDELANKVLYGESCTFKIENSSIILLPSFDKSRDYIVKERINLNFDYSINLVIKPGKPDDIIEMHVIQE